MKFYIRKYSRDLLVFTHFFIDKEFTQYVKTIQSDDHEDFKLIVDAGSNIGCSALLLHILFPTTKIVCIEPEASNFSLLNMNIQLNLATSHIVTMQKALWNKVTDLELMQRDWSHDGFHVMQKTVGDEVISKTTTITIPSLMQDMEFDQIDLIKIDIEGAEKIIFEDENHLQKFLPKTRHLIMEVHDEFISEQTITKQLEKFHFKCAPTLMSGQPIAIIAHRKQTT